MDCVNIVDPDEMDLLVCELSGRLDGGLSERVGSMIMRNNLWNSVLSLAFHPDSRIAFRAAWALEWAYFHDKSAFLPHSDRFIEAFIAATNGSVHRQYSKMLWDMYHGRIVVIDDIRLARIAEKAFDLLIGNGTKPAVMVWCMDLLFDISPRVDWVGEQLRETLERIMENEPSRGTANRAAKILKRM